MTDDGSRRGGLPPFPYGAVYYRVSNPPEKDWDRDYKTAAEDGTSIFRHWFLWAAIERSPGVYTWDAYDRQLDLAAENGIKTIIAEMITVAPEWTARLHPHARLEAADGRRTAQGMHGSCATGGINMCLDNDDIRSRGEEFLRRLAERYRNHPGLGGYDIWNESNMPDDRCFCDGTIGRFREWLKDKYGSIEAVRDAWWRPGLGGWEDVTPPRRLQPYNDSLDWLRFRIDNAYELMQWRADTIRAIDPNHPITAHGLALSLRRLASGAADDWRAAAVAESYGVTWGSSRHGDEPWKQPRAIDLIRAASRGKPFWHAEAYGGPLWLQGNVLDKPRDEGRICYPEDIRYWNLTSYMHGATGTLFLRWRPLLDGPLFGAFGPYGMDGSRTPRSDMSATIARFTRENPILFKSRPVKGDVGIVVSPETQLFTYAQQLSTKHYEDSYHGVYRGFYDNGIQADFVHIDDIGDWDFLYFPYPVMMSSETAEALRYWVAAGGTLISEGCPGYWDGNAHVGETQPNHGLDAIFGAKERYVEFTPDILDNCTLSVLGETGYAGCFLQAYTSTTGRAVGWYTDPAIRTSIQRLGLGEEPPVAAVAHDYGGGRTLLLGTMLGHGYQIHDGSAGRALFQALFRFGRPETPQHVHVSDRRIRARIHDGAGGTYLWIANPIRQSVAVTVGVSPRWPFQSVKIIWGAEGGPDGADVTGGVAATTAATASGSDPRGTTLQLTVPGRDVTILKLEK